MMIDKNYLDKTFYNTDGLLSVQEEMQRVIRAISDAEWDNDPTDYLESYLNQLRQCEGKYIPEF